LNRRGLPVTEKIVAFLLKQSFKIMVTGFIIMAPGIILIIVMQHKNVLLEKTAFVITAFGLGLWLIGRICIIISHRRMRQQQELTSKGSSGSET
jgi:hypothetical protein